MNWSDAFTFLAFVSGASTFFSLISWGLAADLRRDTSGQRVCFFISALLFVASGFIVAGTS